MLKINQIRFVLYGQPITKKNSQQIVRLGNRSAIVPSKAYKAYKALVAPQVMALHLPQIESPVHAQYTYYLAQRRPTDQSNLIEATDDILVELGVLADDNCLIVHSHDGTRVRYDKENPRVEITLTQSVEPQPW